MKMFANSKAWRKLVYSLGLCTIAMTAQGSLLDPNAAAWVDRMDSPADWGTWNTMFTATNGPGAILCETSEDNWGSAWTHVGEADVSIFRYLSVDVSGIFGQAILALAGPGSSDYQEMLTIQSPGQYIVDVSSWAGNGSGAEDVYVVLAIAGANASVRCKEIKLGRVVEWKANMDSSSPWECYNATVKAAANGTLFLSNKVSTTWGKSWTYAGPVDVSSCKKLTVTMPVVAATAKVALSGPNDADYTEFLAITEPGTYSVLVSNWAGNVEGSEDVFVQLITEGQSAEIACSQIELGPDVAWSQEMQQVLEWNSWQATWALNGSGIATLWESGASNWGKSWVNAGPQNVSISRKLRVNLAHISGGSATVALSGPNDSYYQEFLTTSDSGEYIMDVSSWAGNGNLVFVQFIVVGEGASASLDSISFEK